VTALRARLRSPAGNSAAGRRSRVAAFAALGAVLFLAARFPAVARAGDEPFTGPNNFGVTGLYETPTARVMTEDRYRLGATQVRPYRHFFGTVGIFERIEVNARVNQVLGIPSEKTGGDFTDKAIDAKFQLVKEGKYLPALAITISDPHGTRVYASQSVVASKQVYPFDFSLGFGNGRLGTTQLPPQGEGFKVELFTDPAKWAREALPFGGVQFAAAKWLTLLAEYSSVRYEMQTSDPAQKKYFPSPVPSRFNVGLRLNPLRWLEVAASWQRGNEFGVSASTTFHIGRPLVPIYDPPYVETPEAARDPLADRIGRALSEVGFSNIGVATDGFFLRIDAENDRYFFTPRAAEVLLETIAPIVPDTLEYVRVTLRENGIAVAAFAASSPARARQAEGGPPSRTRPPEALEFLRGDFDAPVGSVTHRRWFDYGIKPSFEVFVNDPSGYVTYRLGIAGWLAAFPWNGGTTLLQLEGYPLNNISPPTVTLSIPVRSDVADYKKEQITLGRLLFDQIVAARAPAYFRASAGYLETMFAGVLAEAAVPLRAGRFLAGATGSAVRKRDPDNPFQLQDDKTYYTALAQGRINVPEINVSLDIQAGRFLAGDRGARLALSKFVKGVTLSAWYSFTDTTVFSDPYNRGYHDKGISVDIPINLFLGHDSRTSYRFSLTPWTRDVAQAPDVYKPLFDLIGRNAHILLDKDKGAMYKGP
jgi:hypothetical protein